MDAFAGLESEAAQRFALALQGILVVFFVISPMMGKLLHQGVARYSSLVLVVCTMFIVGNLSYMGMVYIIYPELPPDSIPPLVWIMLSFLAAMSLSVLVGRYMNWFLSDKMDNTFYVKEYDNLSEADMMPFDRRRKREMERRKRSRHDV